MQLVQVIDGGESGLPQRAGQLVMTGQRRDHSRQAMAMLHGSHDSGHRRRQVGRRRVDPIRGMTVDPHASAGAGVDTGQWQQPVGDGQDRFWDPVADRQLGDVTDLGLDAGRHVPEHVDPPLLPRRRRRLRDVADQGHRANGAAPPDDSQRDRRVVLRLVDDDVPVRQRRPVEDRVGLVDEQLVGRRPRSATNPRRRQQAVDQSRRLLRRPRRIERLAERRRRRPRVVAVGAAAQLLLGDGPQAVAALVERHGAAPRPIEPLGDLVPREHDAPRADGHDDILRWRRHGQHRRQLQLVEHPDVALVAGHRRLVDAGDGDLRDAQIEHRALAHAALAE